MDTEGLEEGEIFDESPDVTEKGIRTGFIKIGFFIFPTVSKIFFKKH